MRGYQKKVVYLKNTGSSVFEEAYFVIKENTETEDCEKEELDLLQEANRIIEENTDFEVKRKSRRINLRAVSVFLLGFLTSSVISLIINLLFN